MSVREIRSEIVVRRLQVYQKLLNFVENDSYF